MPKYLHEFMKTGDGQIRDNGWWLIEGDKLINFNGGWHSYIPTADDIIVEAEKIQDLDWSCLIDNRNVTGWLDLNGKFYGCEPFEHSLLAEYYFKSTERDLERIGFIKIYFNYDHSLAWYCSKDYFTLRQEDYLLENGLIKHE